MTDHQLLLETARMNNVGIAMEKRGRLKDAIDVYEENLKLGYPAHHSFKRLMILYRKKKDFQNEVLVIQRAIDVFRNLHQEGAYLERLDKVKSLINNYKK